jgi:hypothetical protein
MRVVERVDVWNRGEAIQELVWRLEKQITGKKMTWK